MMHVVLGDGEMSRRELSSTLEDLLEKAGEEDFWFLVQSKAEPTATDKALMEWISEKGVYYESIGDDPKSADAIYKDAQEKHTVKRLAPKVVSLMQEKPGENEGTALYALFVNNDDEVEEDKWLMDVATSVAAEGFTVFAMNDGLAELGFDDDDEAEQEPEPEPEPAPKKAAAKKAAPKAAAKDDDDETPASDAVEDTPLTREALEELTLPQLKEVAAKHGVELPSRTRAQTYIATLLGENEVVPPEAETEEVEVAEGDTDDLIIEGPALLVVMFNGTVLSRTITAEEAQALLV